MHVFRVARMFRYFMKGMGAAVCIFPARAELQLPVSQPFVRAGEQVREATHRLAPQLRRESQQMELEEYAEKVSR